MKFCIVRVEGHTER